MHINISYVHNMYIVCVIPLGLSTYHPSSMHHCKNIVKHMNVTQEFIPHNNLYFDAF